jgi:hypothetical protein
VVFAEESMNWKPSQVRRKNESEPRFDREKELIRSKIMNCDFWQRRKVVSRRMAVCHCGEAKNAVKLRKPE